MIKCNVKDFEQDFFDNESCLEWIKNKLYPDGMVCPICNKITKHHKVSKIRCYACDNCGHHLYPTAGTIFSKSSTPLKTWFKIIDMMSKSSGRLTAIRVQREFGMSYKTALRLVSTIRSCLNGNEFLLNNSNKSEGVISQSEERNAITNELPGNDVDSNKVQGIEKEKKEQFYWKRDRTARLLRLQMLLCQQPMGLKIDEIARICSISKRTVYRDLLALETELGIPIWGEGAKRGIVEGYFLPPISFTTEESMILFLGLRLIQNFSYFYNPSIVSLFTKFMYVVPEALRTYLETGIEYLNQQPRNEKITNNLYKVFKAWMSKHSILIDYCELSEDKSVKQVVDPYFIEPSTNEHTSHIIGYSHLYKKVCNFNLSRIVNDVMISSDTFEIPSNINVVDLLRVSWGVHLEKETQTVKLRFSREIGKSMAESKWHPSQKNELRSDGSLLVTFQVRDTVDFRRWILGCLGYVEVLEPESLREEIKNIATSISNIYNRKNN